MPASWLSEKTGSGHPADAPTHRRSWSAQHLILPRRHVLRLSPLNALRPADRLFHFPDVTGSGEPLQQAVGGFRLEEIAGVHDAAAGGKFEVAVVGNSLGAVPGAHAGTGNDQIVRRAVEDAVDQRVGGGAEGRAQATAGRREVGAEPEESTSGSG